MKVLGKIEPQPPHNSLSLVIRKLAESPRELAHAIDALEDSDAHRLLQIGELMLVLARLLDGKSVHEAFGAPGDWGYDTPMGDALLEVYRANGGSKILRDRA